MCTYILVIELTSLCLLFIGAASATKRPTSVVMVIPDKTNDDYMEAYDKVKKAVSELQIEY